MGLNGQRHDLERMGLWHGCFCTIKHIGDQIGKIGPSRITAVNPFVSMSVDQIERIRLVGMADVGVFSQLDLTVRAKYKQATVTPCG